jgi:hypothetical protein
MGSIDEKNWGRKSRASVPLKQLLDQRVVQTERTELF